MQSRNERQHDIVVGAIVVLAAYTLVALTGCQTYEVVVEAPAEFWLTAEALIKALALDLWSLVELFL